MIKGGVQEEEVRVHPLPLSELDGRRIFATLNLVGTICGVSCEGDCLRFMCCMPGTWYFSPLAVELEETIHLARRT